MGKLIVHMFMTLDGVIQSPGGVEEDMENDFSYGGWQAPYMDAEAEQQIAADYASIDALLLGRKTYDIFAPYWQKAPASNPFTELFNNKPKYIASRTLTRVDWKNSRILDMDVVTSVPLLKNKYTEVHIAGSCDLIQTLLRHDLIDRMNIWQYPVVLGKGKRLFEEGTTPAALQFVESKSYPGGAVLLRYDFSGKPVFYNMA